MEERDRDIVKMNQDLALVNEMFKYAIFLTFIVCVCVFCAVCLLFSFSLFFGVDYFIF